MGFVEIHPVCRDALDRLGLSAPDDFLRLDGAILGGHPDRHVLQVTLGNERAFLKKEHRVSWRDRLAHWWRGNGFVSKSTREGRLLRRLEAAGIDGPRAIAFGEFGGRAFLLLREETGLQELRAYLQAQPGDVMVVAEALGRYLAMVHAAGFQHRDLYSKHLLVGRTEQGWRFCMVDWQRGRFRSRLSWLCRLHDLATLDASLAENLAPRQARLLCWQAYLQAQAKQPSRPQKLLRVLCQLSARLQRKRRIRELRQAPLPAGRQQLLWLDGEALVVTPSFQRQVPQPPAWLAMPSCPSASNSVECVEITGSGVAPWKLVRRWTSQPWQWLKSWWLRPLFPAPEFEQAAALIRLERFGVEVPRLLALGHRKLRLWQKYSFLLTEPPAHTIPLLAYLRTATPRTRWNALRDAGRLLRRAHEAGYAWKDRGFAGWAVRPATGTLVLTSVDGFQRTSADPQRLARKSLNKLLRESLAEASATDRLRFFLGYHALTDLTNQARRLASRLAAGRRYDSHTGGERMVA